MYYIEFKVAVQVVLISLMYFLFYLSVFSMLCLLEAN